MHETWRGKENERKKGNQRFGIQNKTSQMDVSENMLNKKRWLLHRHRVSPISMHFSDHCLFKIVFFLSISIYCLNSLLSFSVFICKSFGLSTTIFLTVKRTTYAAGELLVAKFMTSNSQKRSSFLIIWTLKLLSPKKKYLSFASCQVIKQNLPFFSKSDYRHNWTRKFSKLHLFLSQRHSLSSLNC